MKDKITTLEELEKEQERLKLMMEVTRKEFVGSVGANRKQLNEFLVKKIAVPLGAAGVGVAVSKTIISNNNKNTTTSSNTNLWKKLVPLGLNLLQAYFVKQQKEKLAQSNSKTQMPSGNINKLKSVV